MKLRFITIGIVFIILSNVLSVQAKFKNNDIKNLENEYYYSYDELTVLLEQLKQNYSEIFSYFSLGKTWQEKDIWFIKISDNVSFDENEPAVLYIGGMHGDEEQGYQTVIFSIKSFVENYSFVNVNHSFTERIRNIVNNTELFFIPMLNPDGCEAITRKNCRPNKCVFGKTFFLV